MHPLKHLATINRHRRLVRHYCFRLGLYRQGLFHDLSKYSPVEFWAGAKYFTGDRSPNDGQRRTNGYSASWMHHKGRNRHHFEYWTDYGEGGNIVGIRMPIRYVGEMFCDRIAASRVYRGKDYTDADPWLFYQHAKGRRLLMHPETDAMIEHMLLLLRDEGEEAALAKVRQILKDGYPETP